MVPEISVRELKESESADALLLVWDVFMEYEAPDYSEEGIAEFYKSIHDEGYLQVQAPYVRCIYGKQVGWRYCDAKRGRAHRSVFCKR